MGAINDFTFYSKYSRFDWDKKRRETWYETVDRVMVFLRKSSDNILPEDIYQDIYWGMLNAEAAPSMRLLNQAGIAAEYNGLGAFNCSYIPMRSLKSFADLTYALLSGTGVGLSVEFKNIEQLPNMGVIRGFNGRVLTHKVEDTSEGWANAILFVMEKMFEGFRVAVDYSKVRASGEPLMTKGGVSAGPDPLKKTIGNIKFILEQRRQKQIRPIDAYDIACWIADGVVSGGNRRSALLTAFDFYDEEMRHAKDGEYWKSNPQRMNSNNSAVIPWERTADTYDDIEEFVSNMLDSFSGEPGIINPMAYWLNMPEERAELFDVREVMETFRTNPCGEIILQPYQTCNLTNAIIRPEDTLDDMVRKVYLATVLGVLQADITNFRYVGKEWHEALGRERILGVSLTGFAECPLLREPKTLRILRQAARDTADEISAMMGMERPTAITTVKPSGNSSLLYGTGSGIHAWHDKFFLRNTMVKNGSSMYKMLQAYNAPMTQMETKEDFSLVHFPVMAPEGAITRNDMTALEQLKLWRVVQNHYADHAVSATISYSEDEKDDIRKWVVRNIDAITGLSFLRRSDSIFNQMPLEAITEDEYHEWVAKWPEVDFSNLRYWEDSDLTESAGELACSGGVCEVDFTNNEEAVSG